MINELEVLNAAEYNLEKEDFDKLKEKHPYIGEKLILDLVNGVNVVARDLNDSSKSKEKGFVTRTWDAVSGISKKRQNKINENIIEGLNATSQWLRDHDKHLGRIDLRIKDVADELYNTQDEILKFYGQFKDVDLRVEVLEKFKKSATQRFNNIEHRLTKVEAHQHVDREIVKIGTLSFTLVIEIFTILDNLVSGEAGLYYIQEGNVDNKNEFLLYIKNKIKNKIDKEELKQFIDYGKLISDVYNLESIERKGISFISSQYGMFSDNNPLYEMIDFIKVVSTSSQLEAEEKINKRSHIRTFMTLESFVDNATEELLTV